MSPMRNQQSSRANGTPYETSYDRLRDLPRLLRIWPGDVVKLGEADRSVLVERLRQMLRDERRRGLARHWSYDLSRHAALLRAHRAEAAALARATLSVARSSIR
jgi:endonuclease/exonuclease/phosphatase family metal-dependent hydrolase